MVYDTIPSKNESLPLFLHFFSFFFLFLIVCGPFLYIYSHITNLLCICLAGCEWWCCRCEFVRDRNNMWIFARKENNKHTRKELKSESSSSSSRRDIELRKLSGTRQFALLFLLPNLFSFSIMSLLFPLLFLLLLRLLLAAFHRHFYPDNVIHMYLCTSLGCSKFFAFTTTIWLDAAYFIFIFSDLMQLKLAKKFKHTRV